MENMSKKEKKAFRKGTGFGYLKGRISGFSLGVDTHESIMTPVKVKPIPVKSSSVKIDKTKSSSKKIVKSNFPHYHASVYDDGCFYSIGSSDSKIGAEKIVNGYLENRPRMKKDVRISRIERYAPKTKSVSSAKSIKPKYTKSEIADMHKQYSGAYGDKEGIKLPDSVVIGRYEKHMARKFGDEVGMSTKIRVLNGIYGENVVSNWNDTIVSTKYNEVKKVGK